MLEIWKDIEWYEWKYQVSDYGNVKNKQGHILYVNKWDYLKVKLFLYWEGKNFYIHRLVASAFISNENHLKEVNHIDWNKTNNCLDNLEWCTRSENEMHAHEIWLKKGREIIQYDWSWNYIRNWDNIKEAAIELDICWPNISKCCRGKRNHAWWFWWKYRQLST